MTPEKLDRLAALLVILIFCLFALAGSEAFHSYRIDVQNNYNHCHPQQGTADNSESKDCQGLIYKTIDDPVALFTFGLFIFTMALAIFTLRLVRITKDGIAEQAILTRQAVGHADRSAKAAQDAADVARDGLIASQRAWIRPTVGIGGDLLLVETGAYLSISFVLENIGKQPAQNIKCVSWLLSAQGNPFEEHKRRCDRSKSRYHEAAGFILFPSEKFPSTQGFSEYATDASMSKTEVERATFEHVQDGSPVVTFYVGGAVNYKFPSDIKIHQSSFIFELGYKGIPAAFALSKKMYLREDLSLSSVSSGDGRQAD